MMVMDILMEEAVRRASGEEEEEEEASVDLKNSSEDPSFEVCLSDSRRIARWTRWRRRDLILFMVANDDFCNSSTTANAYMDKKCNFLKCKKRRTE